MEDVKKSKLYTPSLLETKDEVEEKMESGFEAYSKIINGLSEREAHDALTATVSRNMQQYEEITMGLMYVILTDPALASKAYRDLTFISRDGLALVWNRFSQMINERFAKMSDMTRKQVLWFAKEMVKILRLLLDLFGHVLERVKVVPWGGDISPRNMWLAETLLDLLSENRAWLDKFPVLMAMVCYTYLRIIEDHSSSMFTSFRQKEVDFCIQLLRSKFMDCCKIGRDLIRLLQNVARIPEFEKLWKDMIHKPQSLSPQFTGQIWSAEKISRLVPKTILEYPESQSLRCDLIRYICCNIHPSNEILSSEIIQRWAVIGWLLTTCTSNVAASNAKLALFYDWLLFNPARGNIMDIEPGILVMHHSMRSHPAITATLWDFLCRIIPHFYPPFEVQIRQGIVSALRFILEKRVLSTLAPLLQSPKLDKELRAMIKEHFSEFCQAEGKSPKELATPETLEIEVNNLDSPTEKILSPLDAAFSDDDDEEKKVSPNKPGDVFFRQIKEVEEIDVKPFLEQLDGDIKEICQHLLDQKDSDMEEQCDTVDNLCSVILRSEDFDSDVAEPLSQFLCGLYNGHLTGQMLPDEITTESMEDTLGKPLFVIYRNLSQGNEEGTCPIQLLTLVCVLYEKHTNIGYSLLFYLHGSSMLREGNKLHVYEEVCKNTDSGDLISCLVKDFRACQEEDVNLLCYLVPPVYTQFAEITIPNTDLLQSIVSCIDSAQLQTLICRIMQGDVQIYKKETLAKVVEATLRWETFEQYCVWQLLSAHDIEVEHLLPVVSKLRYRDHPEAIASLLLMLKMEQASPELLKPMLLRTFDNCDQFTTSLLSHWVIQDEQLLAELFKAMLLKSTSVAKRLRQRQNLKLQHPTPEQLLGHLNNLRLTAAIKQTMFFSQEALLQGLQHLQHSCSESQKTKFSDMFELLDVIEDLSRTTRSRVAKRSPSYSSPKSKKPLLVDGSSSESDQDDELMKAKGNRKRKKSVTVGSDSD
ncbi:putative integrator complex subunit 3-like [Apostichopus japonicus]|uniref:Putative integrator complex subunit 3-like n=1 Tax=Stichopus japonicus TaxID=307972 RepID=A0A2G8LPS1_STIJA|nr:putative integrator complex subunit 3-like [Apostichopus japonicus]